MRLINADAIEEKTEEVMEKQRIYVPYTLFMEEIIDQMPTIDAVEVIRCKECTAFYDIGKTDWGLCIFSGQVRKNDFCSWAERKEEHG